ncbi:MAG: hypothetical protein A2358_01500 [Candidatus Staskawiczbacteria bacterium RIFOXYB1_FULL_37_44]|uniref:O-antigen polymerase n=1 Tax=Candidatus Staskawiczbacteria bacterium RIFOXYB1_FULL_37_44 TaxID=1802223 RepID=A0A1G2IY41_9BACT|nr:MAG: hypothetical protein A2358_01500 [Candidatus Staskawiczbacteria bacterium RIFOXYB1_FULL_37_44]OGZ83382.1 MAG: hypothetical protein A2416_02235 [Candidatus Staskawiczbacteria bacterium RIFOXYC1_FULL_37_52]OGZ86930.1 MAG: hypothetical protein A2444_01105 [Candidatus Staskawiczbacteria bacterium RIFOXYC2_FULL_37_19]OGZ88785.1 MAG: hypothetical protein A2581_03175 [Candidatus Staskawiczbacteria bacterium RIFOXYD1_FULL_37_110]
MKISLKNLSITLLLGAIMLFPSFVVGRISSGNTIELRIEDFLLLFFGIVALAYFLVNGKSKFRKPPFFMPILFWLAIEFFSVLINLILGNLFVIDRAIFYFLKEIELIFLYFFVYWSLEDIKSIKNVIKFTLFFTALNVAYVFYQIVVHNQVGEYGTAALPEYGVFPTGAFFVLLFIFLLSYFIFYYNNLDRKLWKKILMGGIAISPAVGVFGSGSKTNFIALLFSFVAIFLLAFFKKNTKTAKMFIIGFIVLIFLLAFFAYSVLYIKNIVRIMDIFGLHKIVSNYSSGRIVVIKIVWKELYDKFNQQPLSILFGFGVGYITEAHNQFLRNFGEIGILGSLAFLVMIFLIFREGFRIYNNSNDLFLTAMGVIIIVMTSAMMVFSFTTDPFFSVKTSEVYWFFMAICAAVTSMESKRGIKENKSVNIY